MKDGIYKKKLIDTLYYLVNTETHEEYQYSIVFKSLLSKYYSKNFMKQVQEIEICNNIPISMIIKDTTLLTHYKFTDTKHKQIYGFIKGVIHRDDGPAVYYDKNATFQTHDVWYKDGKKHRVDGPALTDHNNRYGKTEWYLYDVLHREDGPAVFDGYKYVWYRHGKRHRIDGPASYYVEPATDKIKLDRPHHWYINDAYFDINEWIKENDVPHWSEWTDEHKVLFALQHS